jgi:hypothetical protein
MHAATSDRPAATGQLSQSAIRGDDAAVLSEALDTGSP